MNTLRELIENFVSLPPKCDNDKKAQELLMDCRTNKDSVRELYVKNMDVFDHMENKELNYLFQKML